MKNPKEGGAGSGWHDPRNVRLVVVLACVLLLPLLVLYETRTDATEREENLQVSYGQRDVGHEEELVVEGRERKNSTVDPKGTIIEDSPGDGEGQEQEQGGEEATLKARSQNNTVGDATGDSKDGVASLKSEAQSNTTKADEQEEIECDFSQSRTDVCQMRGDVRVHGPSSSILLVSARSSNSSFKIKPYARKWENGTMSQIRELSLRSSADPGASMQCSLNYTSPAIVFSTGAFKNNYFHEIVDALIPLFTTSHQFAGDVHLLVEDFNAGWMEKYNPVIRGLTRYEVVDLDTDGRVHCFRRVVVGLWSQREMGIDPQKPPYGVSMLDFKAHLRRSFGLRREFAVRRPGEKPRMLFLSRKESRTLVNEEEVLRLVRGVGYEVVVAGTEMTRNLTAITEAVNSCDVLLGVHGAGLTNMVFLPANATMVQIIPWGEMKYPCRWTYGEPATGMGLRYVDYEVTKNETSLFDKYPKNDPVLTDPLSIHKQGFTAIWAVYLHQDLTLDIPRFKDFLSKELLQR